MKLDGAELVEFCSQQMKATHVPRYLTLIQEWPMSASYNPESKRLVNYRSGLGWWSSALYTRIFLRRSFAKGSVLTKPEVE